MDVKALDTPENVAAIKAAAVRRGYADVESFVADVVINAVKLPADVTVDPPRKPSHEDFRENMEKIRKLAVKTGHPVDDSRESIYFDPDELGCGR